MGNWCYFTPISGIIASFLTGSGAHLVQKMKAPLDSILGTASNNNLEHFSAQQFFQSQSQLQLLGFFYSLDIHDHLLRRYLDPQNFI